MKELNKTKVYSLEDLTSDELEELINYLKNNYDNWENFIKIYNGHTLYFDKKNDTWYQEIKEPTANAKELFYTLENVQVDCRELSEEQIKEMKEVVVKNGYTLWDYKTAFELCNATYYFVKNNEDSDFLLSTNSTDRYTITYEKFMELFTEITQEVTDKPKHYSKGIDTFARMEANCTKEECLAFAKGNIDKYNFRTKGQDLEDYKKIVSYAQWAIKLLKDEK